MRRIQLRQRGFRKPVETTPEVVEEVVVEAPKKKAAPKKETTMSKIKKAVKKVTG